MFCKWCGKKIENIGSPCPSCGKNQDPLENGNGFWDLCSKEADVPAVTAGTSVAVQTEETGKGKTPKKKKAAVERKPANSLWIGTWVATVALLLIAIIVIVIGVGKIDLCLSEISSLRTSLYNTNSLVANGFAKLEEYHLTEEVPETQVPEETEPVTEPDEEIDLDTVIAESILLVDDEALNIESYEIDSTPAKCVYIAVGEVLENENVKLIWQKSVDQGENWGTISEAASYIIAEVNETDAYRVVCIVTDDSEAVNLYVAATIELKETVDSKADDTESDTGSTTEDATESEDTDETQPTGGLDKGEDADLDTGNNDDATAVTDPEDGAVG